MKTPRAKWYTFQIGKREFQVKAEPEGQCRYMVRMSEMDANGLPVPHRADLRIGYLTGRASSWLAEYFGAHPSTPASTARAACLALAAWAEQRPGFQEVPL